jgi:acetyltransferase-like isoleucine patch superfamily enzyme/acyl carrier protein
VSESSIHALVHRATLALASLRAKVPLRRANVVGPNARVFGVPYVENRGKLEIGADFTLSSEPVVSHLVVGRGATLRIGNRVSIGHGAAIATDASITIEDDVILSPMVMMMDTDFHDVKSFDAPSATKPIVIEEGARIGAGAVILKGSHVGRGARVAAGSVVFGVVPPGALVRGVPARPVRERAHHVDLEPAEVAERVRHVVADTFGVQRSVELSDGPRTIPGWDSLGILRLLVSIEDELGLSLPDNAIAHARTVGEIVDAVLRED